MKFERMKKYIYLAFNSLGLTPKKITFDKEEWGFPCVKIELDDECLYIYCEATVPTHDDLILESGDRTTEDIWDEAYEEYWFLAITMECGETDDVTENPEDFMLMPIAECLMFYQVAAKAAAYVLEQKAEDALVDLVCEDEER